MVIWLEDKREYERECKQGIKFYIDNNTRVERLILSKNPESKIDIIRSFEIFCQRILSHSKYGQFLRINFIVVYVNHQHLHIIFTKPFCNLDVMMNDWNEIINHGKSSDFKIKTLRTKDDKFEKEMNNLVTYNMNQGDKHNTYDVLFFKSEYWGKHKSGDKKKKENIENIKGKKVMKKEEYIYVNGQFILESEFMKQNKELKEMCEKTAEFLVGDKK